MNTEFIITPEVQAVINTIKSTGKNWFEMALPDHPVYPQFARKLVVTGFNTPDLENDTEERIYVNIRQYLILKEGNKIYKLLKMPDWIIHEGNVEEVMGSNGQLLTQTVVIKNDAGNVISTTTETVKVKSVQYVRFLMKTKAIGLVDVFARFMSIYADKFKTEIDNI